MELEHCGKCWLSEVPGPRWRILPLLARALLGEASLRCVRVELLCDADRGRGRKEVVGLLLVLTYLTSS